MNTTTKWTLGIIIGALIVIGIIVALVSSSSSEKTITIGLSLPLSGEAASFGDGALSGIETAVHEINNKGGINGKLIELVAEDDKCNANGGITALTKLVNIDQVDVIIGPVCSAAAGPGLPVVQQSKTPIIIWASAPGLTQNKDYVFRTYPSDAFQGKFAADYMKNTLQKNKVAVIYVKNDWGQGIRDVFIDTFGQLGGEITFDEGIPQDAKDLKTTLTKAKETSPDALYFPVYPGIGIIGLKQMKELGLDVPILGGDAFATDEIIKSGVAEDVMFTNGVIRNPDDFQEKVNKLSTKKVNNLITPLGYDAIYIFANIIEDVGTDKTAIRNALASLSYTEAVSLPLIEFDNQGDLKEATFEVKTIKNKKAIGG